jgi:hypothetical protein
VNFRRSLIKLTLGYMLLIIVICSVLSFVVFRLGSMQLERRLELRQQVMMEDPLMVGPDPHFLDPHAVNEVKHRLGMSLLYFNFGVVRPRSTFRGASPPMPPTSCGPRSRR